MHRLKDLKTENRIAGWGRGSRPGQRGSPRSRFEFPARMRTMQKWSHRGRASTQDSLFASAAAAEERGWQNFAPYSKSAVAAAADSDDDSDGFCTARLMCIEIAGVIFYRHRRRLRRHSHLFLSLPPSLSFYTDSHCNPPPPLAAATTSTTARVRPSVRPPRQEESNMAAVPAGAKSATAAGERGPAGGGGLRLDSRECCGRAGAPDSSSVPPSFPSSSTSTASLRAIFLPRLRSNERTKCRSLSLSLSLSLSQCGWRPLSSIPTASTTTTSFSCFLPSFSPSFSPFPPFFLYFIEEGNVAVAE